MLYLRARTPGPLLVFLALATIAPALAAQGDATTLAPKDLIGEWVFFKDLSPPRAGGQLRPNQGVRFVAKLVGEVLELEQVRPGNVIEHVRIALDGSTSVWEKGGENHDLLGSVRGWCTPHRGSQGAHGSKRQE